MQLAIDVEAVIDRYHGASEMARFFTLRGFPVTRQAISRWKILRTIPMHSWLSMKSIDRKLNLDRYLTHT